MSHFGYQLRKFLDWITSKSGYDQDIIWQKTSTFFGQGWCLVASLCSFGEPAPAAECLLSAALGVAVHAE